MYINLSAVLIVKTRKLYRVVERRPEQESRIDIRSCRGSTHSSVKEAREKKRLNFIGRVANNFFAQAVISATDASQLAIFYSFFTRRFMLPALFLSPPSLKQLAVLKRISSRARQFFHEIIFSSAAP